MVKLTKTAVADEWVNKYTENGKLTIAKRELAKLMMANHPGLWATLNAARLSIQYRTGSVGDKNRRHIKNNTMYRVEKSTIEEGLKRAGIITKHVPLKPLKLKPGKWLILSDIHIPFQHDESLAAAIAYGLNKGCTNLLLNGDIIDCYGTSRFTKEVERPGMEEEIAMTREFLGICRKLFPDNIVFRNGNHEERMRKYILGNAVALAKLKETRIEYLLGLEELGITFFEKGIIKAGKLNILHGHEFGESTFSPVNPARGAFIRGKCSILMGHNHQRSTHSEGNLNGDRWVVHTTGALCHLDPEYRPFGYTKWNYGAATLDLAVGGKYRIDNFEIIDGEIYN